MAMASLVAGVEALGSLQRLSAPLTCSVWRHLSTTSVCQKNLRSGKPKITINRSKHLTYEEAQPPHMIGVRKAWNSWNTSSLTDETGRSSQTAVEDIFIRKFIAGTWPKAFVSQVIIKRRHNMIVLTGLVDQMVLIPRKIAFLQGYSEEFLSILLRQPVKMEIQTVGHKEDLVFKRI